MSTKQNSSSDSPPANVPRFGPGGPGGPGRGPMAGRINVEKPKNTKQTIIRLLKYLGKSKLTLCTLLILMLAITFIDVSGPLFQQKAIDTISFAKDGLNVDFNKMKLYLIIMAVIFTISALLTYFQNVLAAKLSQKTVYYMRGELFKKISYIPIRYTDTHKHGDIMSRLTNDVENVSNAISQSITALFSAVLTLIGALCMMLYYSITMTLIAVTTIPITIFVSSKLTKFMRKYFMRQQKLLGQLNGHVEEMVTSYKTVVAYSKEEQAVSQFAKTSDELRKCSISARVWGSIMGPIMNFIGNLQYVLIAATGGFLVLRGKSSITIGSIQAMLQYSRKFSHPINMIANQYSTILTALSGAERIFEILDSKSEINEGKQHINIKEIKGDIEFKNIQFGYIKDEPVLKNFNLSVKHGQKIAIVGATGSGKTTVVNLLTRFYELDAGCITIDGIDITSMPKEQLRSIIAIVLQDTVLFNDSIKANIKYGNLDTDDEAMREAAQTAMAHRFIERLPDGYDTVLAESGADLSGGQRQLLSISRAVLKYPKILIFDEATSSVDTRTEMYIQQAMVNLMKGRTSLIIAHRLSTIRDSDVIVVVKDGAIAESGSHDELIKRGGEYYNLYNKQFAGVAT